MTDEEFDAALAAIREGKACDNDCEERVGNAIAAALRLRLRIPYDEVCALTRAQIIEFIDSIDDEGKERLRDVAESLEWVPISS
jgi:hypothetical protein